MKQKIKNNLLNGPKNLILVVIIFVLSLAALTKLTDYSRQTKVLRYSEFIAAVEQDTVKSVHVVGSDVYGIYKDGTHFEATIAENPQNFSLLKEHNVDFSVGTPSGQISFWHILLILSFLTLPLALWYFFKQSKNSNSSGAGSIFSMGRSKAKMFMPATIKTKFADVAGAKDAKQELYDIVDYLKNPDKYKKIGAKITRGVLLVGEPGNGKTLLAKAVAGEANCPFFSITGSDFIEVFVGVGAARVRDLFAQARKNAPSIIFIDEIDAIGRQRGTGFGGGHDEREQTLNQLLTEMDGFDATPAPVIILAATNMPEVLDKALLRPGRFDRRVDVPFPDLQARHQILSIHGQNVKLADSVDLQKIAEETAGFSGADLANLMNKAALIASKKNNDIISMEDLLEAHKLILDAQSSMPASANTLPKSSIKVRMIMPYQIKISFKDVAGLPEAKEEVQEVVDFLKNPDKYKRMGAQIPRGILLCGEPGNGKTLLAKAIAGEAGCPFFPMSGSEFVEMYVGVGAARVRELFAQARKHSPCIIFIDEIDAVGSRRYGGEGGQEERNQTLNQLLIEMDGFDTNTSIIVIGATNRVDMLDDALKRRLTRHIDVAYPDLLSREQILKVHTRKMKLAPSVDLHKLARGTPGFSGASLANLANEAAIIASRNPEQQEITMRDFDIARDRLVMGKEYKHKIMNDYERRVTAFHEAGHALAILMNPEYMEPLFKLTILPMGSSLGSTHWLPERDKYITTKNESLATIKTALGGRAAEELVFNEQSTGAGSDFIRATELAQKMVRHWGMSENLGPVIYNRHVGLDYSVDTANKIDLEVRELLQKCYKEVQNMLIANRDKLDLLAHALLEKEIMFAEEVYELLGITPRESFKID